MITAGKRTNQKVTPSSTRVLLSTSQPVTGPPLVSPETSASPAPASSSGRRGWGLAVPVHAAAPIGEPLVQDGGRCQEAGAAKVLRVLKHQEEVEVPDEDSDELHDAPASDDHVEGEQHPGEVHGFELGAEPEVDDHVLVELAPDVEDAQHL